MAKEAAQFTEMIEQLSKYVATSGWKQASAHSKFMTDLKDLALVAPARPTKTYVCRSESDAFETTGLITLGVVTSQ